MKKAMWVLMVLALAGCGDDAGTKGISSQSVEAEVVTPQPAAHNYSMKDGYEYGYEQAVSQDDLDSGKVAKEMLFFKYAGERDGIYQAYVKDGQFITSLECANPCEFMKVLVFVGGSFVSKERMRATEGAIGWYVMADAINGHLEPFATEDGGKKFNVWFSEEKGLERILVTKPTT